MVVEEAEKMHRVGSRLDQFLGRKKLWVIWIKEPETRRCTIGEEWSYSRNKTNRSPITMVVEGQWTFFAEGRSNIVVCNLCWILPVPRQHSHHAKACLFSSTGCQRWFNMLWYWRGVYFLNCSQSSWWDKYEAILTVNYKVISHPFFSWYKNPHGALRRGNVLIQQI